MFSDLPKQEFSERNTSSPATTVKQSLPSTRYIHVHVHVVYRCMYMYVHQLHVLTITFFSSLFIHRSLVASILQPHTSPHPSLLPSPHHTPSLCTTSHLHWAHPQRHIDHAHSESPDQNIPFAVVNSTCSSTTKHGATTLTTCASNNDHCTTESHTDTKVDSCSSLACPNTHRDGSTDCSAFTTDSGTSLHAPNVNYTFTSQGLPHTFRYRHLSTKRDQLSSCEDSMEETYNHSMFITSFSNHQKRGRRRRGRDSCGEGGLKVLGLQAQGDATTSTAVSHDNAASTDGTATHSQSPRNSRMVQVSESVNLLWLHLLRST